MKKVLLPLIILLAVFSSYAQHSNADLKHISIESKILNETREVYVSLPKEYEKGNVKYPTLYLLDGLYNYSYLSAAVNMLSKEGRIPQMIIVCVENKNRMKDMTPTYSPYEYFGDSTEYNKETGQALKFLNFIDKELGLHIDSAYRTSDFKILSGHSFTGLATLVALLDTKDYFDAFISVDPSVWWDKQYIVNHAKQYNKKNITTEKKLKLYIGGSVSGDIQQKPLLEIIKVFEKSPSVDFASKIYTDESHLSVPYPSQYDALKFIYKDMAIPYKTIIAGKSEVEAFIKQVKETYDYDIILDENYLLTEAFKYISNEKLEETIQILEVNLQLFERSLFSLLIIADCYRFMNKPEKAKEYFERVLKIDPKNEKALAYLKE